MSKDIRKELYEAVFVEFPELTEEQKHKLINVNTELLTVENMQQRYCGIRAANEYLFMMVEYCGLTCGRFRWATEEENQSSVVGALYDTQTNTPLWNDAYRGMIDRIADRWDPLIGGW